MRFFFLDAIGLTNFIPVDLIPVLTSNKIRHETIYTI